jgi:hypothetical protein
LLNFMMSGVAVEKQPLFYLVFTAIPTKQRKGGGIRAACLSFR